ncbi:hypothetical protein Q4493_09130 [Colwellia sp. 1_MG-2023]|uniref:hypothetical protein n=1 Tax=Colwellia sp. 1_MG-2023 TaxID=3062649 RepID=UPI0026E312AC|nr:hypothetical protein [Colwellia sp. 1_MG-2023]MDO6445933.1 hypothetical protein [Colwellia sp. 1_MG-2023]
MESDTNKLDIEGLLNLKKKEMKTTDSDEIHRLHLALQSIQKRLDYCEYHFYEFKDYSTKEYLLKDIISKPEPNCISARVIFEASTYAFIQNLHAVIDSLPYALNIIFTVEPEFDEQYIGWNKRFIKKYKGYSFYCPLDQMFKNDLLSKLKRLSNNIKHKHLIRIKNGGDTLCFDDFTYKHQSNDVVITNQNVEKFLVESHDKLIPQLLGLYTQIKNAKKKELSAL